ncbi:unnamed protein product [Effrenium voratum]|nr:unnamed protein product [Effrenium voratum]
MLFILRTVAIFVTLVVALALRPENLHLEEVQEVSECPEVCAAVPEAPGSYAAHGADARTLQHKLQPGDTYFAGSTCDFFVANASVVPWIPPKEDPVTKSYIAVYIDPLLLGPATEGQLCASRNSAATCLCQLRGHQALGVLGALASVLPASKSLLELQLAMQRRCPAPVPNLLAATVLTLLALVALLCAEAAWSWRKEDEELEQKAAKSDLIHIKPAFQSFKSGIGWLLGFVTSLSALQTGALLVVEKSCDVEAAVWLVAAMPAFLALAAAVHFTSLLCKQQLVHAYLQHGQMLVDLPATIYLDKLLFLGLIVYGLLVVFSLGLALAALAVPALAGPCWALLQSINASRDIEKMQHLVLTDLGKLGQGSHQIQMLPWVSMLDAARGGRSDLGDTMTSDAKPRPFRPGGITWHRHHLRRLTGSSSGFLVIPGFFGVLATSWIISAVHMASYACAKGELTHLRLASSDAVVFQPWQPKYNAAMDVSFQQVAVQAMSAPPSTRRISFTQPMKPSEATGTVTSYSIVQSFSAPTEEIQLSHRMVPRVATITVEGLRSSLPTTRYEIRFSPLVTLPVLLQLTAPNFAKKVAWSTLPGSILSVPAGLEELQIAVFLADFVVGVPEADPKNVPAETLLWTGFEAKTNQSCADSCRRHPNCLTSYDGHDAGCFFAFGNRSSLENGTGPPFRPAHGRSVRGWMQGCRAAEPSQDHCAVPAEAQDSLKFNGFLPDWRSMSASLVFELHIEAGEQEHDAEVTTIELQQGPPIPIDVIGVLVGDKEGGSAILLKSNAFVDTDRKITVEVSEYQPLELKNLRLLLLPILPDHDFEVHWGSLAPAAAEDQKYFENSAKCRSPLLRSRYKVCGAPLHGQLDDQPRKFELNPLTGQPEQAMTFEVWPKSPGGWDLNSAPHKVDIRFVGVDSPIAWAARREGCSTLENVSAAVAASADAACHLLRNYTDPCRPLCQLMDKQSFGGQWQSGNFLAPLLSERGLAQAMSCHLEACRENYTWSFRDGIFFLVGHSARASSKAILEVASKPGGLEFVKNLHQGFKAEAEEGEKAKRTYEEVLRSFATEVWTIPFDAATVEALASFSETMPKLLLKYWVTSRGALPENVTEFRTLQALPM